MVMYWFSQEIKHQLSKRMKRNTLRRMILQPEEIRKQTYDYMHRLGISFGDLFDSAHSRDMFLQLSSSEQEQLLVDLWNDVFDLRREDYAIWREKMYPWVIRLYQLLIQKANINDQFSVSDYGIYRKGTLQTDIVLKVIVPVHFGDFQLHITGFKLFEAFEDGIRAFEVYAKKNEKQSKIGVIQYPMQQSFLNQELHRWINELYYEWESEMKREGITYYDYKNSIDAIVSCDE